MTTLAINRSRDYEGAVRIEENAYPVIASDIIYEGAAVGIVAASGHARPLVAGDRFAGFASARADNSAGAAAAINVDVKTSGRVKLPVTGAVISDNESRQAVYASDDDTFSFSPVGGSFVGFFERYISAGVGIVEFNSSFRDPWARYTIREALTATKTFDAQDCGKLFWATGDGTALTLPSIADGLSGLAIVSGGAFGTQATTIDPAAADMILGPDISGGDNKDLINTKATQRRGDYVVLIAGDADGYMVTELRGIWAREG
jgi:hypothetical protein